MNQSNQIHDGFRDQMTNTTINGIQNAITSGFGDVQLGIAGINQNLCQTGNGIVQAVNSGFAQAEASDNARQIANMQTAFANQTAMNQGFNGVQTQLAQCLKRVLNKAKELLDFTNYEAVGTLAA